MKPKTSGVVATGRNPTGQTKWFLDLIECAKSRGYSSEALKGFNFNDWKSYFDDGYTPTQALNEDESNA